MAMNSGTVNSPFKRTLSIAILAIAVSSCSHVANYSETIGELKSALDSSTATLSGIDKKITEKRNEQWRTEIVSGRALLEIMDGSCAIGETECSLVVRHSGEEGVKFPLSSVLVKSQGALTALNSYVADLKAIVDADTTGDIKIQTNKALLSLTEIEAAVAKANGQDLSKGLIAAYSEPAGAWFNWALEQYVERLKYNSLAKATKRAHPAIIGLGNLMATVGEAAATQELSKAHGAYIKKFNEFTSADDSGAITEIVISEYVGAAAIYDQALKANAAEPLAAFTSTHEKLMQHLNNEGDISLADVMASIKDLKKRAKEFKTLVDGFKN